MLKVVIFSGNANTWTVWWPITADKLIDQMSAPMEFILSYHNKGKNH